MRKVLVAISIGVALSILFAGANKASSATQLSAAQIAAAKAGLVTAGAPSGVPCWFHQFSHQWGTTPFEQVLIDKVYYCSNGKNSPNDRLIYRTSQVSEQTDLVTQGSTSQTHLAGAADGSTYYVEWEACGNFSLGLPYIPGWNRYDCMAMWVRDDGSHQLYWNN